MMKLTVRPLLIQIPQFDTNLLGIIGLLGILDWVFKMKEAVFLQPPGLEILTTGF